MAVKRFRRRVCMAVAFLLALASTACDPRNAEGLALEISASDSGFFHEFGGGGGRDGPANDYGGTPLGRLAGGEFWTSDGGKLKIAFVNRGKRTHTLTIVARDRLVATVGELRPEDVIFRLEAKPGRRKVGRTPPLCGSYEVISDRPGDMEAGFVAELRAEACGGAGSPITSGLSPYSTPLVPGDGCPAAPPSVSEFELHAAEGRPAGVAAGEGDVFWFSDPGTSSIGRYEDGNLWRYRLPRGGTPGDVALGPDGSLWFTDADRAVIGRVTAAGEVAEFPTPTRESNPNGVPGGSSAPHGITPGSDGAMWFTEAGADMVGRITPDGVIREFPAPGRERMHAALGAIVAGPDGAMWFTEPLRERIARIDVSTGAITEFPLPNPEGGLVRANTLAVGPDGALWFEDPRNSAIGRMTTTGAVTLFPLPAGLRPGAVTAGPGWLWFVDRFSGNLMSLSPDGVAADTGVALGADLEASRPAVGKDGSLWFVRTLENRVARVDCRSVT